MYILCSSYDTITFTGMNNSTLLPGNDTSLNSPGFMAYCILMSMVTFVASLFIGITFLSLLMATSIPRPLRLFLINLLLAGLLVVVTLLVILCTSTVLIAVSAQYPGPRYLCRVYLWVFGTGVMVRLWSLTAFSFSILGIVRFGKKTISWWSAAVIILILWLAPMTISLYVMLPYLFEAQFVHGVACFPERDLENGIIDWVRYTFSLTWILFGGVVPLIVSIIVLIVCLCYITKHTVTEGVLYRKGLAKFSLFLVVGGSINVAGQALPALLTLNSDAPGVYLSYGLAVISLLPTPVIIMAYLKPVQEQAKRIISCGQLYTGASRMKGAVSNEGTLNTNAKL